MEPDNTAAKQALFVVSAPSGAGKTSLCRAAVADLPGLTFSISHTTRAPREGEVHGHNYFFVTRAQFQQACEQGEMAEWTEIYGNCYGTAKQTIQDCRDRGQDILFDIDERGARQLQQTYPDVVTILILPPSMEVLERRLVDRGTDSPEVVRKRLAKAEAEMNAMGWYRYVIVNDRFADALEMLKAVVRAERCRRNHDAIQEVLGGTSRTQR